MYGFVVRYQLNIEAWIVEAIHVYCWYIKFWLDIGMIGKGGHMYKERTQFLQTRAAWNSRIGKSGMYIYLFVQTITLKLAANNNGKIYSIGSV